MRKSLLFIVVSLISVTLFASEELNQTPISVDVHARASYNFYNIDDVTTDNLSGFKGDYLNLSIYGNITKHLSLNFLYKVNGINEWNDLFKATDILDFSYRFNKNWSLSAGKQVVGIGGWEYYEAPIDIYYYSTFWSNIHCFQFGFSGSYTTNDNRSSITLQMTNSPFIQKQLDGLYSYNLLWTGDYGLFHSRYSLNFVEYEKHKFINYIVLGNKITTGGFNFYIDYINRYAGSRRFFDSFTIISQVEYTIKNSITIFEKGGYDQNMGESADSLVGLNSQRLFYGLGVEYCPLKKHKGFRLHAEWDSEDKLEKHHISAGLTWKFNAYRKP